jgi:hypothetical protein
MSDTVVGAARSHWIPREAEMEAIGFVVAIVALGVLAMRFGRDSREGFRSKEQELAASGVTWCELTHEPSVPSAVLAVGDEPPGKRRAGKEPYPTLAFIERALGHTGPVLTTAPNASSLEPRALALVSDYWSDSVWRTGVVPEAAYRRVLAELAPDVLLVWVNAGPLPDVVEPRGRIRAEPAVADDTTAQTGHAAFGEIAVSGTAA